jgi:regulator of RNase E activity RraA
VQRGDLIVGDADGVLVLPPELAASLVDDCAEQELQERFIAEQVASGASVDGLYPIGPAWLGLYEKWRSGNVAR